MKYLAVKNFEEFQHYGARRTPPWIKLYNALLDDYAFLQLSDAARSHLMLIWLLASRHNNRVPYDLKYISDAIHAKKLNIAGLIASGFLFVREHDASTPLAECSESARADRDEEVEKEPTAPARVNSVAEGLLAQLCGEHYPVVAAFLEERPSHLRDAWAADLLKLIGPATGNLPADLARAVADGQLAEPPVTNAKTLRIFLASCREERLHGERPPLSAGARALRASITGASTARGAAVTEAGNLVAKIRELAFDQTIPGQGSRRMLRNADVERMGDDISRAYRTVGGAARFLALEKKPEDVPFLINAFADALVAARSPEVRSA